jgi:hypothetical protein
MCLLEQNPEKINWEFLSENPSIFELDYKALEDKCSIYKWELLEFAYHPLMICKYLNMGITMGQIEQYV